VHLLFGEIDFGFEDTTFIKGIRRALNVNVPFEDVRLIWNFYFEASNWVLRQVCRRGKFRTLQRDAAKLKRNRSGGGFLQRVDSQERTKRGRKKKSRRRENERKKKKKKKGKVEGRNR
jgi:hypothetical protein